MPKIALKILSPKGIIFDQDIDSIDTTTFNGRIGLRANQNNLVANIEPNLLVIYNNNTKIKYLLIDGLLYSTKTEIKIFTDICILEKDINALEIKKQIELLENDIKKIKPESKEYLAKSRLINIENKKLDVLQKFNL